MPRPQNPQRHLGASRWHRPDPLTGSSRSQERLQLENVLRETLGGIGRAAQGVQGHLVGSWRAAKSETDATREQTLQGAELFGDDIGRMIGQHDAARADPDALGPGGDISNDDRCRRAGDARHIVMLGHP